MPILRISSVNLLLQRPREPDHVPVVAGGDITALVNVPDISMDLNFFSQKPFMFCLLLCFSDRTGAYSALPLRQRIRLLQRRAARLAAYSVSAFMFKLYPFSCYTVKGRSGRRTGFPRSSVGW